MKPLLAHETICTMCRGADTEPYHSRCVVSGRRTATRVHMREVRGYGVANSAGPGEALANRRYGIKGGVSAGGSWTTRVGSVEERRLRPLPSSKSRLGSAMNRGKLPPKQ